MSDGDIGRFGFGTRWKNYDEIPYFNGKTVNITYEVADNMVR